jgi:hypothetical protein
MSMVSEMHANESNESGDGWAETGSLSSTKSRVK